MKMNIKSILSACVIFVALFSSCTDDTSDYTPVNSGDGIKFTAGSAETRTIYDDENIFQINWQNQDAIKIYCNKQFEGGVAEADYKVTPIETSGTGSNKLYNTATILPSGSAQLQWADNAAHNFIAVYPGNNPDINVNKDNGNITFPIVRNQRCQPVKVDNDPYYSNTYKNVTYYAKPDMNNAYLTAYTTTTPEAASKNKGNVFLNFKPVMTTLEVVVNGPSVENQTAKVTGISIRRRVPANNYGIYNSFVWNAKTGSLPYNPTDQQLPELSDSAKWTVENTFVGLDSAIVLKTGESIIFTAFVPPLRIGGNKLAMNIRVHATGSTELVTNVITNEIEPSNKRRITLKPIEVGRGNNWITPLDDNIFLHQLSIPGSHDAVTAYPMSLIGDAFGTTQEVTMDKQWDLGVRCFDMRVAIYDVNLNPLNRNWQLWMYHGPTRIHISWEDVMTTLKKKLSVDKGEFAIMLLRHENEGALAKDENPDNFRTMMKNWLNRSDNKDLFVEWRPNLTIGECRGKILLLSRFDGNWTQGAHLTWPDNVDISDSKTSIEGNHSTIYNSGDRSIKGDLYVQDFYKAPSGDNQRKYDNIIRMFKFAEECYSQNKTVSLINHISGYTGVTTSDSYAKNAEFQNKRVYDYLKTRPVQAPAGLVLCDYTGASTITFLGTRYVNGDLLLQEIINTNYKYRMRRKGETLNN